MPRRQTLTVDDGGRAPDPGAPPGSAGGAWGRRRWSAVLPRAVLPAALLLWLLSLRHVAVDHMGDLGLIQVLPVLFWAALALLTVGFALALRDRRIGGGWLAGYVLGLVAMIHATPSLLYPELRYSWAWKHVAVVDAMLRHGNAPVPDANGLEIYNEWPGFFVLNALFLRVTGLSSPLGYAAWAPPLNNALLLAPLLLLYRSITRDRRLVWGGVWLFYACSWVGQDYFAPQALAFLLYATVIALVMRQLPVRSTGPPRGGAHPLGAESGGGSRFIGDWRWPRFLPVVVLEAVIASSHQLTPLMLMAVLIGASIPRRNRRTTLPPLAAALALTLLWDSTVGRPYLSLNVNSLLRSLLSPDGNITSGFAALGSAAPGQVLLAWIDRGMSAAVFALAAVCVLRRPWVRRTPLPWMVLAPLPLMVINDYGGEMVFRVYLGTLPFTAFLTGVLLLQPRRSDRPVSALRPVLALGLTFCLLGGLVFGYYGKEEMNYFTPKEAAASRAMYAIAPNGSVIVSLTGNLPAGDAYYDHHPRIVLNQGPPGDRVLLLHDPLAGIQQAVDKVPPGVPAFLILNRGQNAETFITGTLPADTVGRLAEAARTSSRFTLVYRNDDAAVYRFIPNPLTAEETRGGGP